MRLFISTRSRTGNTTTVLIESTYVLCNLKLAFAASTSVGLALTKSNQKNQALKAYSGLQNKKKILRYTRITAQKRVTSCEQCEAHPRGLATGQISFEKSLWRHCSGVG